MMIKQIVSIAVWLSLLLITAELKNARAYECIAPARQNCLQCHTRGDIHSYHWTQLGLTDPPECLLCHCGDAATSPCENVPGYGPVETLCCTTCHEKCAAVDSHTDIDQEAPCLECHGDCAATSTIPVQYMHDSMCRKCHSAGSLHAQSGHDNCDQCHSGGVPRAGNVDAANCTVWCHPLGRPGTCNLVNDHDAVLETLCRNCHQQCLVTTTTTSMPDCDIMISPSIETVYSEQSVHFTAETTGAGCLDGVYQWGLNTCINSSIDPDGRYTAGFNDTGQPVTDTIVIEDAVNQIILEWPIVVRFEKITAVVPGTLRRSPWFILPQTVMIEGEGNHFNDQNSVVIFYPPASVIPSWQTVVTENLIVSFLLVMPSWYSGNNDEQVMLMVMTGDDLVTKRVSIEQFPFQRGAATYER
jgi:hypothetical protein